MKPLEWNELVAAIVGPRTRRVAYDVIEREARLILNDLKPGQTFSTSELAEVLYPVNFASVSDAGIKARKFILSALTNAENPWRATYAVRGTPVKRFGQTKRPWIWGMPRADVKCSTCPTCGQEIF